MMQRFLALRGPAGRELPPALQRLTEIVPSPAEVPE
jgi:hypothetical protein